MLRQTGYWNNHHHLPQAMHGVLRSMLWANLHLLFWLSLVPFATAWMGENHYSSEPTALYGLVLLMAALTYRVLQQHRAAIPRTRIQWLEAGGFDGCMNFAAMTR